MTLPYERIAIALDVGEDWADPWDARRPERGTRAAVVVSALRNYVARKSLLSPRTRWALVALDDGAEPLLSPGSGGGAGLIVAALESLAAAPPRRGGAPQAPFPLAALAETLAGDAVFGSRPPGAVDRGAGQESEIPNFKASYLGRFPLVSADFWTSDHFSERSRSVDTFSGTRTRGTFTLKRT